jgi:hypothetical protein
LGHEWGHFLTTHLVALVVGSTEIKAALFPHMPDPQGCQMISFQTKNHNLVNFGGP